MFCTTNWRLAVSAADTSNGASPVKVMDIELYRVDASDQTDHDRKLAHLEVTQQMGFAWLQLVEKANGLGQNAQSGGLICIKLYANLFLTEVGRDERRSVPVELEFYGESIKIRIPKYGSTLKRLRPFEADYSAGGLVSRAKLASAIKKSIVPGRLVAGGMHVS
jgi:hypothetical protein